MCAAIAWGCAPSALEPLSRPELPERPVVEPLEDKEVSESISTATAGTTTTESTESVDEPWYWMAAESPGPSLMEGS